MNTMYDQSSLPGNDSAKQVANDARMDMLGTSDQAADKAQPVIDRLASSAHDGLDKVSDTIDDVSGSLAERSKQMGKAYKRFTETGRSYVRSSPALSLLMAAAAGSGLPKLFCSRQ